MTHIDNRIQEDSLLLLDILLACTVKNIANDFHKIIPNFIDMISKLRLDSKPGRTLTINLNSQMTSVKWRVKVLHRLEDFLQKYVDNSPSNITETRTQTHIFNKEQMNVFPLFNESYISTCDLPIFSTKSTVITPLDEVDKFKSYIETLMPLLFEIWLEVNPNSNNDKNTETLITEEAAILLKHVLQVISLIWNIADMLQKRSPTSNIKTFVSDKYKKTYSQHFLTKFPYITNIRSSKSRLASSTSILFEDVVTNPKLTEQNLTICHLFVLLNPNINVQHQLQDITAVLNYIEKTFNEKAQEEVNTLILQILDSIFCNENSGWIKNIQLLNNLFCKIIWAYFNRRSPQAFHEKVFNLLCKIAMNDKLTELHNRDEYLMWIKDLPNILLGDTISTHSIGIIHRFAVCNNKAFNDAIRPTLLKVVENLSKIKISDNDETQNYIKLFSLLYWIEWDKDSLNLLESQLLQNKYKGDHCKIILDTLLVKSTGIFC